MKNIALLSAVLGMAAIGNVSSATAATRIVKTFDKWRVTCSETDATSGKQCVIQYALTSRKKQLVFSWSLTRNKEGKYVASVRTPNNVLLTSGVKISFPNTKPATFAYRTCGPKLCLAQFEFSDNWAKYFTTNPMTVISYEAVNGSPLKHEIPLQPFKEAYSFFTEQLSN